MGSSDILSQSEIDNLLNSLTAGPSTGTGPSEGPSPVQQETIAMPALMANEDSYNDTYASENKGFKLYNFRRPDKFSKDHLRALMDIHKEFSRQLALLLSTYLRMHVDIDIISVDQLTYDEFTRSMPNPITIGILELNPLPGQVLLGMSHEITSSIVDRMLGGVGASEIKPRELTDIEEALARRVFEKITKSLEDSWKGVFPVQGTVVGLDSNYTLIQIAGHGEIVALITLEVQIANKYSGLLSLCYPYPVLEVVVGQLSSQHIFQAKGIINTSEDKQVILNKLNNTNVIMDVILGDVDISVHDLVDLKIGDVLRLNNSVSENLVVKVNGIPKFLSRPGIKGNRIAINVMDVISKSE
ncbi:MAG: flagellar motor switch protein FliM [Candidatus Gastranaerophilales bacterium]|nr:flagellar motor switch protein FliM [Candidatus Gastranaerophilales bacterium]